jgi:hypothetical protein
MLGTILLILLILLLAGCFHFRSGPWPSGGIGVLLLIVLILVILRKL